MLKSNSKGKGEEGGSVRGETMTLGRHRAEELEKEEKNSSGRYWDHKRRSERWELRSSNIKSVTEKIRLKRVMRSGQIRSVLCQDGHGLGSVVDNDEDKRKDGNKWVAELRKDRPSF